MFKAIKVRLYPTSEQRRSLRFQFGAVRWVYNRALQRRSEAWREHKQSIPLGALQHELVALKRRADTVWLRDADSQALQQSLAHLEHAFQCFFAKRSRYPRFKSRRDAQSMSYPQRVKVVGCDRLYLPKVGRVKAVLHREIAGRIKTVTISRTLTGKYFASILCDDGLPEPKPPQKLDASRVIGIDVGVHDLVVTSDGHKEKNPRFLKNAYRNLRCKSKSLSRKEKGSANRNKARGKLAKAHERLANARHDFHHKVTRKLVDDNQAICAETLGVKNMLRNRRLSKHIADASWGELLRQLEYKARWDGKVFTQISRWYPSTRTCGSCGTVNRDLTLADREWQCGKCGAVHDRDINAAVNIRDQGIFNMKAEGLSVSACGGMRKMGVAPTAADEAGSLSLWREE